MAVQSRLAGHLRILAILWFVISAFRMLPGIALLTLFGPDSTLLPSEVPAFVSPLLHTVGFLFIGGAAIGLIAGWGLLERQPWARTLTIVLGCVSLFFDVPFGTALGIYTLWVLWPASSEEEYRRLSSVS